MGVQGGVALGRCLQVNHKLTKLEWDDNLTTTQGNKIKDSKREGERRGREGERGGRERRERRERGGKERRERRGREGEKRGIDVFMTGFKHFQSGLKSNFFLCSAMTPWNDYAQVHLLLLCNCYLVVILLFADDSST